MRPSRRCTATLRADSGMRSIEHKRLLGLLDSEDEEGEEEEETVVD